MEHPFVGSVFSIRLRRDDKIAIVVKIVEVWQDMNGHIVYLKGDHGEIVNWDNVLYMSLSRRQW